MTSTKISFTVETSVSQSVRAQQVCAMFDAPPEEKCEKRYEFDFPWDAEPWNVGLIVGPSGSGKSTVLRHVWGEPKPLRWDGAGMIDDFEGSVESVAATVSSVGFSTIPAWLRPHRVLSMGEQFRADVARRLMGGDSPVVIDEYTSVVDRQVAKVASHAIQRHVRSSGKKLVAVGCHYDVIDWLQPDWVLDMATQQFTRRLLQRRPSIECVVGRLPRAAWGAFAPFHYMSAALPTAAHGFGLWADGRLACSAWIAHFPHPKVKDIVRVARVVTLPDFQGIGIAFHLLETLGGALTAAGKRFRNYPAHPQFIEAHRRKTDTWKLIHDREFGPAPSKKAADQEQGSSFCAVFEFIGQPNARYARTLGLHRGKLGSDEVAEEGEIVREPSPEPTARWSDAVAASKPEPAPVEPPEPLTGRFRGMRLVDFVHALSPEFDPPTHLEVWCGMIERCLEGGVRGLCSVPIRHHKTWTTLHGLAWLLIHDPTMRIILMCADHMRAAELGKDCRLLCTAAGVGPERGQNTIADWKNEAGGGVCVMSAEQSRLGRDIDVLVFDDPVTELTAGDAATRESVDRAIGLYTTRAGRKGRRGSVIGLMSRWDMDDPIGRRLLRKVVEWKIVQFPAIIDEGLPTERAFAPNVMTLEDLNFRRAELRELDPGERVFQAQYMNNPQPENVDGFRDPARYDSIPPWGGYRWGIGVDLAYTPGASADYFALVLVKFVGSVAYVDDVVREKADFSQLENLIRNRWSTSGQCPIFSYVSGPEVGAIRYFTSRGIPIQGMPARYNKGIRAQKTKNFWNAGKIQIPTQAAWAPGFISRTRRFTGSDKSRDDDEVDALVSVIDGMMGSDVANGPRLFGKPRM